MEGYSPIYTDSPNSQIPYAGVSRFYDIDGPRVVDELLQASGSGRYGTAVFKVKEELASGLIKCARDLELRLIFYAKVRNSILQ